MGVYVGVWMCGWVEGGRERTHTHHTTLELYYEKTIL